MFCTQCGAPNPDSNSFCTKCGARLATNPSTNQGQPPSQSRANDPGQTTQIASNPTNAQQSSQNAPFAPSRQPVQHQVSSQPGFPTQQDPRFTSPVSEAPSAPQGNQTPMPQAAAQPHAKSVHDVMSASQPMPHVMPNAAQTATAVVAKKTIKRSGKKIIIPVAIAVVILLGIGIAAFLTDGFGLVKVSPKSSVNEYSWGELSKIANEISKAGSESSALDVAKEYNLVNKDGKLDGMQTKDVILSNGQKTSVMITGIAHDEKTKGGKAGLTFMFTDAIYSNPMNSSDSNSGGWEKSQMRSWLASDGLKMLPDDLQKALVEVEKKTNNTGQTSNTSSVTTTSDKLWLFSSVEVCGSVNWNEKKNASYDKVLNAEGTEYAVFKNMDISSDQPNKSLIRKLNGESCFWWTRSSALTGSNSFYEGNKEGFMGAHLKASSSRGVVPGFCL